MEHFCLWLDIGERTDTTMRWTQSLLCCWGATETEIFACLCFNYCYLWKVTSSIVRSEAMNCITWWYQDETLYSMYCASTLFLHSTTYLSSDVERIIKCKNLSLKSISIENYICSAKCTQNTFHFGQNQVSKITHLLMLFLRDRIRGSKLEP